MIEIAPYNRTAYTRVMRSHADLDHVDLAILARLKANARISNKDLAEAVGLAPSTCLERVRRLVETGAIHGFHADVDLALLGFGLQALIAVRLKRHSRELVDSFRSYVLGLTEVRAIYHVAGADDYLVHVAARDADHLRDLALDAFTTRSEVAHIETRLIFEHVPIRRLPLREADLDGPG
jgi:DNA-binding Lrp family transcriptional regulator